MKPRSKMSRPLGPPAPAWPLGNPNLLPARLHFGRNIEAMVASTSRGAIEVIDLTVETETTAEERGQLIMLQGYVMAGANLGLGGKRE